MLFLLILAAIAAGAITGTVALVRTDGYGPRPDRNDRTAARRRVL
jgi:hypothetical protein